VTQAEGNTRIAPFGSRSDADEAGRRLLEAGVGPIVDEEPDPESGRSVWWLSTLTVDAGRACEVLGVELPEGVRAAEDLEQPLTKEQTKWRIPREKVWKFILLYIGILIAVSVAAFIITVFVLGGFDTDVPVPTTPPREISPSGGN